MVRNKETRTVPVKEAPVPLETLGDETRTTNPGKPASTNNAPRLRTGQMKDRHDPRDYVEGEGGTMYRERIIDDDGGESFIFMVNTSGDITTVSKRFVQRRMLDGYQFLKHETAIPITRCENQAERLRGHVDIRPTARPASLMQADEIWLRQMRIDKERFEHDPTWEYDTIDRLQAIITRRHNG